MGKYLRDLGIKTTASLQKHIIMECGREVICVKEASGVKIIWCYNNSLLSTYIPASVIYVIQEDEVTKVIKEIKDSIENPKVDLGLVIKTEPVMVKEGLNMWPFDLGKNLVNVKRKKPIKCYELHRANMPQYGCTVQCPDCKEREQS